MPFPDGQQSFFHFRRRRFNGARAGLKLGDGLRQPRAVNLSARRHGKFGNEIEIPGDHVVGQSRAHSGDQPFPIDAGAVLLHDAGGQFGQAVAMNNPYGGSPDAGFVEEDAFDFLQLHPEPADLDLIVNATEELDVSIRQFADKVMCSIQDRCGIAGIGKRIANELFCGERLALEIAASHSGATDQQFPRRAGGNWANILVDDEGDISRKRAANGNGFAGRTFRHCCHNRCLRRAVGVQHTAAWRCPSRHEVGRAGFSAEYKGSYRGQVTRNHGKECRDR